MTVTPHASRDELLEDLADRYGVNIRMFRIMDDVDLWAAWAAITAPMN